MQKDHLFGERKVLIGTWEWVESDHFYNCLPSSLNTLNPDSISATYSIEITRKEEVHFFKDGEIQLTSPLSIYRFRENDFLQGGYRFSINIEGGTQSDVSGNVNNDSLILDEYYPDTFVDRTCHDYTHYFIKRD